jgi:AAA15 family ATPase/GTPase
MVKSVEVKNFKSISDLKIELGRVNVFIGENGSGKSNILEAVAFGAAASANKLDREFLVSRGMRVPEPKLMRSAFDKESLNKGVKILLRFSDNIQGKRVLELNCDLINKNTEFSKWENKTRSDDLIFDKLLESLISGSLTTEIEKDLVDAIKKFGPPEVTKKILAAKESGDIGYKPQLSNDDGEEIIFTHEVFNKYKIYAPENTFLRRFEDEEVGDPLGIKGEGLFRLLRYFQTHEDKKYINAIKEALAALDWFEDFKIPDGLASGERKLSIIDRFLDPEVSISQNSANEGFLFILFYISLFVSEDTPSFFAIDNLDASFNPKLCKHITQILIETAKKTKKQVLFTTHNPFILDGLDLADDEQRLFVVYRTQEGHTTAMRVKPNERKMKLSEQWMNGFLGGLPENF